MQTKHQIRNPQGVIFDVTIDTDSGYVRIIDMDYSRTLSEYDMHSLLSGQYLANGLRMTADLNAGTLSPENMLFLQSQIVRTIHLAVWDMPTLADHEPVIQWLAARWEVHFGVVSDVILVDKATGRPRGFATTDVREALDTVLTEMVTDDEPTEVEA